MALRLPATRINDIVNEKRGITADTALRLSRYFGRTSRFWMNMPHLPVYGNSGGPVEMKRFWQESSPILATLLGLLGMIWSFHLERSILAVSSLVLAGVGAVILIVRYVQPRRPQFTISSLHKELHLNDADGHRATFERRMVATCNVNGLKEVWYRNVAADGKIENIRINGKDLVRAMS